jgi:hypothetical protein
MPKPFKSNFRITTVKEHEVLMSALRLKFVSMLEGCKLCKGSARHDGPHRAGCQSHAHELSVVRAMMERLGL